MKSAQISSSPLLRQFAVAMPDMNIQVATKLGQVTLYRADFPRSAFPDDEALQDEFLRALIRQAKPSMPDLLGTVFDRCVDDQRTAVKTLISENPGETK